MFLEGKGGARMPWFRVDDGFHSHPKTLVSRPAALGLWVVAGSWSSANLTEGFIPDAVLPRLMPGAKKHANELIASGLWKRVERGPDRGFAFHDWCDYNPSADEVRSDRKRARERMRNLRARRRRDEDLTGEIEGSALTAPPDDHGGVRANNERTFERTSEEVRNPVPSHPVPSRESFSNQSSIPPYPPRDQDDQIDGQDFSHVDEMVIRELAPLAAQPITAAQAAQIRRDILARARGAVKNPHRYIQRALRSDPHQYLPQPPRPEHRGAGRMCPTHPYMPEPCRACAADRLAAD
ncbi:hypothetical protein [Nonomuraea lactucae]|uniref:hypothetical protein n=1 Tax=Nonomuraea lactucae TaxID=2249762 RepID=UPI001F06432E|nr:hypothetical protein [Nonomuraea lactucae]